MSATNAHGCSGTGRTGSGPRVLTGTPGYSRVDEGQKYTDGAVGVDRVEQPHGRARREADDVVAVGAHQLGDAVLELPRLRLAAGVSG